MRYAVLSLCLLFASAVSVKADDPPPKDEALDKSVDQALAFLQSTQLADGAWGAGGRGAGGANPAVTSLCVMSFLSAGHVPGEGRYGETVEKGIRWVLQAQLDNGLISANKSQEMYQHGICTLMLAEAAGMTDGKLGEEIRKKLVKAVDVILKAQRDGDGDDRGGWRYMVEHVNGSDISVTGWQIMALRTPRTSAATCRPPTSSGPSISSSAVRTPTAAASSTSRTPTSPCPAPAPASWPWNCAARTCTTARRCCGPAPIS